MTSLPSQAAEQVSLGNVQGFQQTEVLNSKQHTVAEAQKGQNTTFTWSSVAPGYVIYPPFLQQNKELSTLPYFPFIAPSSHVFVLLRLQTWLRILMRDGKTLPRVERFK